MYGSPPWIKTGVRGVFDGTLTTGGSSDTPGPAKSTTATIMCCRMANSSSHGQPSSRHHYCTGLWVTPSCSRSRSMTDLVDSRSCFLMLRCLGGSSQLPLPWQASLLWVVKSYAHCWNSMLLHFGMCLSIRKPVKLVVSSRRPRQGS